MFDEQELLRRTDRDFQKALSLIGFPEPTKQEHHVRNTRVIFCNPFGFTIRLSNPLETPLIRHRHLARPIGSINVGSHRLDIVQGRPLVKLMRDCRKVSYILHSNQITAVDIGNRTDNLFLMPQKTEDFPDGIPIAFDASRLEVKAPNIRIFQNFDESDVIDFSVRHEEKPDEQDIVFKELRDSFAMARNNSGKPLDQKKFKRFLRKCKEAKERGLLCNDWLNEASNPEDKREMHLRARLEYTMGYKPLRKKSKLYEVRLLEAGLTA